MESIESTSSMIELPEILDWIGAAPSSNSAERRTRVRASICGRMELKPLDDKGQLLNNASVIVGKDVSVRGISFSHDSPLECSHAVISFSDPEVGLFCVEVEITWTRVTPIGLYESGCRFTRTMPEHNIRLRA
jgi:hypothetical protein